MTEGACTMQWQLRSLHARAPHAAALSLASAALSRHPIRGSSRRDRREAHATATLAAAYQYNTRRAHCCVSTPLEDGTVPARRGSASVARRSARANALNVASMMWWLFLPASLRMCGRRLLRDVASALVREAGPTPAEKCKRTRARRTCA